MAGLTTYNSRLIRMAVTERTIPDSGDAVQRHFDRTLECSPARSLDAPPARLIAGYQQLINEAAPTAQRHESFITLDDEREEGRQGHQTIRRRRGRRDGRAVPGAASLRDRR